MMSVLDKEMEGGNFLLPFSESIKKNERIEFLNDGLTNSLFLMFL